MVAIKNAKIIKIKPLDPQLIPDEAVCVFIGKRRSGKSCAIRDLMWHKRHIPIAQVISGSEHANPFFQNFFPSSYIEGAYSDELINNILERQTKIKRLADITSKDESSDKEIDPRFLLVFDDCLHDNKWQRTTEIKTIFMNGRHFSVFFILSLQYVIGIPPNLRTNIDYVFVFRDTSIANRRKLYENFGGCIPTFHMFCALMDSLGKYECLVICTDADKVKFDEQVMYWKAKLRKPFKFGCHAFWKQDKKIKAILEKEKSTPEESRATNAEFMEKWRNESKIKVIKKPFKTEDNKTSLPGTLENGTTELNRKRKEKKKHRIHRKKRKSGRRHRGPV